MLFDEIPMDAQLNIFEYLPSADRANLWRTGRGLLLPRQAWLHRSFDRRLNAAAALPSGWRRAHALAALGWTLAHLAEPCQTEERRLVLAAAVNKPGDFSRTALHDVVGSRRNVLEHVNVVRWLLAAGADPNATDAQGQTPLHIVIVGLSPYRDKVREAVIAQLLLTWPEIDANTADLNGRTPLRDAVKAGIGTVVDGLLAAGASPNAACYQKMTPLHVAVARGGHGEAMVPRLLKAGAQPDAVDSEGMTPLQQVIASDKPAVVAKLTAAIVQMSPPDSAAAQKQPRPVSPVRSVSPHQHGKDGVNHSDSGEFGAASGFHDHG